ncbi:MAG: hydrogenase formation protein HypD [Candidatus Altiarchaeales archaeon A3]|nr:MAG: hydrogenase formation protein HypD [Candidatus Altiarchaeales archaeon A3]
MKIQNIISEINELAGEFDELKFMEVCGTHTQTIARCGIRQILPKNIKLISGPGCPVCVTSQYDIDAVIELALNGIHIATYGDMLRVPGTNTSLEHVRAKGANVSVVYSVEDCFKFKNLGNENDNFVFFAIGFETTAPMTAYALKKNLAVYSVHKMVVPAMEALLKTGEIKIDGFINPGHVSVITGTKDYKKLKVPQVITGFEGIDVLAAILMLLRQLKEGICEVENEYVRAVKDDGNLLAKNLINEMFKVSDSEWRGLGVIKNSGLEVKDAHLNARIKFKEILKNVPEPKDNKICKCGEIIRGLIEPYECPLFGKACNPDNPIGPCMVSGEGTCAIYFKFKNLEGKFR